MICTLHGKLFRAKQTSSYPGFELAEFHCMLNKHPSLLKENFGPDALGCNKNDMIWYFVVFNDTLIDDLLIESWYPLIYLSKASFYMYICIDLYFSLLKSI